MSAGGWEQKCFRCNVKDASRLQFVTFSSDASYKFPQKLRSAFAKYQYCFVFQTVVIHKAGGPLGLSIVGGADHTSHPFGVDEPGVFVSKVIFNQIFHSLPFCLGN